jgi:hypothetical protein
MSMHQVKMAGDKRRRDTVDDALLARCNNGEISWVAAIGLADGDVEALRAHGRALCNAFKFAEALEVLQVLPTLSDVPDRHDALYLGFCYEGLGDMQKAEQCFAAARAFNEAIEAELAQRAAANNNA